MKPTSKNKIIRLIFELPRALLIAVFWVLWILSHLMPRDKKLWLFDEWDGTRCADNARYLYLHASRVAGYHAIWLTHNRELVQELRAEGLRAYLAHSPQGLWYTLRAGVIIVESHVSVFFWLTGGIRIINLWHGLPIKKIVYDSAGTKVHNWVYHARGLRRLYHIFFAPQKVMLGDYILSQSRQWQKHFSTAFRVPLERVLVGNQPRNEGVLAADPLFLERERPLVEHLRSVRAKKKILTYLPTFRDGKANPLEDSGLNFAELDAWLGERNLHLLIKAHHEQLAGEEPYRNIEFLPVDIAAMLLLRETDVLVTDYSSIFVEFLVLDRPIIFYAFDLDRYTTTMREMYFNYDDITPGPKARTLESFKAEIERAISGTDTHQEARARVRKMVLNPKPEHAAEQMFRQIVSVL
ncbi:MAG: CDP-glycerol glycerophosphotransferase family protein [Patescibacteria group bacterium]